MIYKTILMQNTYYMCLRCVIDNTHMSQTEIRLALWGVREEEEEEEEEEEKK